MPIIKNIVREMFPNCKIYDYIDPEEVIAYGATLEAEKILYNNSLEILNLDIFNVATFSFGINAKNESRENEYEGDIMNVIIKRGSVLPAFNEIQFSKALSPISTTVYCFPLYSTSWGITSDALLPA